MRQLIIGLGEVGRALKEVFEDASLNNYFNFYDEWSGIDLNGNSFGELHHNIDIMHVCIGYTDKFVEEVEEYQRRFHPKFTIIHSSVPVGTSTKLGAMHSPIRGLHPNLKSGILTFPKFIGGQDASQVADVFRRAGMKVILFDKPETTEALKLFDTEYYRHCIEFAHRVKTFCDKEDLNFSEVYTIANQTYNEGYTKLGHSEYVRPVLQPIMKEIGGHCLLPNAKLIKENE